MLITCLVSLFKVSRTLKRLKLSCRSRYSNSIGLWIASNFMNDSLEIGSINKSVTFFYFFVYSTNLILKDKIQK